MPTQRRFRCDVLRHWQKLSWPLNSIFVDVKESRSSFSFPIVKYASLVIVTDVKTAFLKASLASWLSLEFRLSDFYYVFWRYFEISCALTKHKSYSLLDSALHFSFHFANKQRIACYPLSFWFCQTFNEAIGVCSILLKSTVS